MPAPGVRVRPSAGRSRLRRLAGALLGCGLWACGGAQDDGTAAMAARLAAKVASTDPFSNMYLNDRRAERLREQVQARGGDAAPVGLRAQLASELLFSGRTEQAIALLEELGARMAGGGPVNPQAVATHRRLLTLAYLRLGEQCNCLDDHNPDSCLIPIRGGGLHDEPAGSRRAMELLEQTLRDEPDDWEARWLYNLAAMTVGDWPHAVDERWLIPESVFASGYDLPRFPDVAAARGVALADLAGGVVMDDLTGDGRLDLLVSSWGLEDPLHLLVQTDGGAFEDRSEAAGLAGLTGGLNMVQADYDNDGDVDVLVLRGAWFEQDGAWPNSLLRNEGDGRFVDVTEAAGLLGLHPTQTAAWGDYDGDGWLDLFIGNETGPHERHASELFHNQGDGTFVELAAACGVALEHYVKGVVWGDVDDDGDVDLYVSRIDGRNLLLRNDGPVDGGGGAADPATRDGEAPVRRPAAPARPWRFVDVADEAGVTEPRRSFPTWFFDYDNDGRLDLFVSGYRYGSAAWVAKDLMGERNKGVKAHLYRNLGGGRFEDVSEAAGVDEVLLTMGCNTGDLDNDGYPDFYVATGEPDYAGLYPNRMFRNDGAGRFDDVTTAGGFGHVQKGHAIAFGDLDGDGDQDVYAVMGGAYSGDRFPNALFENPGPPARWLTLRLEGVEANRSAIGARIRVTVETPSGTRDVHGLVGSGGSFGGNSLQAELGLGDATGVLGVEIRWPGSGRVQRLTDVPLDAVLHVVEGAAFERVSP